MQHEGNKNRQNLSSDTCGKCGAWKGELGLEPTPELYVKHLVEIFRELRRVLRDDGVFWLNIGDSYASGKGSCFNPGGNEKSLQDDCKQANGIPTFRPNISDVKAWGMKPKDLIGIPWMLAFALRADGWYLRSDLVWIKRNSMPSSVTDRPASSIEHVFLFSKSRKYYYDHIATMQPSSESYNKDKRPRGKIRQCVNPNSKYPDEGQFKKQDDVGNNTYTGFNARYAENGNQTGLRFMRDSDLFFRTWQGLLHNEDGEPMALVVNPRGYKGAHFACFPIQLVEPMILAGTSEKGVCPVCGAPWKRIVSKETIHHEKWFGDKQNSRHSRGSAGNSYDEPIGYNTEGWQPTCNCSDHDGATDTLYDKKENAGRLALLRQHARENGEEYTNRVLTVGFTPTCTHNLDPVPATVLDPFSGSSATGVACKWHNRDYIGIELNLEYCKLAEQRIKDGK
jgi:DNA modification methylase